MSLPVFFFDDELKSGAQLWLDEDTARHIVQVLRMQVGEPLQLTNGKGFAASAKISITEKKKCAVSIDTVAFHKPRTALHLCVAFTKNSSRNEWLLEKATELGVESITPLLTTRSEREKFRYDRMKGILISALLQSQQYHLPQLDEAMTLPAVLDKYKNVPAKFIAHCIADKPVRPVAELLKPAVETIVCIGPEGDFTPDEVTLCIDNGYAGISLGSQRLRTETAAIAACAYFNMINNE